MRLFDRIEMSVQYERCGPAMIQSQVEDLAGGLL